MIDKELNKTVYEQISRNRNLRYVSYSQRMEMEETELDTIIKVPKDAENVILNLGGEDNIIIENDNFSILIPQDESDRLITIVTDDDFKMKFKLIGSYLEYDQVGTEHYSILLSIKKYERDVMVSGPHKVYSYPIYDMEMQQDNDQSGDYYIGQLKSILAPFEPKKPVITEHGTYEEVITNLTYYKNKLKRLSIEVLSLAENVPEKIAIYFNNSLYHFSKLINDNSNTYLQLLPFSGKAKDIPVNLPIKDWILSSDIAVRNAESPILYNGSWYNNNDLNQDQLKLLSNDYSTSAFAMMDQFYKLACLNIQNSNVDVFKDCCKNFMDKYHELRTTGLLDILKNKIYYIDSKEGYINPTISWEMIEHYKQHLDSIQDKINKKEED